MALPSTYANVFKHLMLAIRTILREEFGSNMPVVIGHETKDIRNQYIILEPVSSELIEYSRTFELKEYSINMHLYNSYDDSIAHQTNEKLLSNIMRLVARTESLIHDNVNINYATQTETGTAANVTHIFYNTRIENTEYNTMEDEEKYVVTMNLKTLFRGNLT